MATVIMPIPARDFDPSEVSISWKVLTSLGHAVRFATPDGQPVRYIRSMYVPGEAHCMCLFEASDPAFVREVNETAQIPFTRIVEAADLAPA